MRRPLAILLALQASAAAESSISVTLNQQGHELAADLGLSVPELIAHAETRIDELYRVSGIENLLRSFANTAGFAQRGLGADYDLDAGDTVFGVTAAGVHGDVAVGTTNPLAGSIVNLGVLGGTSFARWGQPRLAAFGNAFYQTTTFRGLEGDLITVGAHAQYVLVPPTAPARARWTGLAATIGLEYARWAIGTSSSLESRFTAQGPAERATIHMSSTGTLDVLTSTLSVPVELTTGVRFFGVLSLYAGGGLALATGEATIVADLDTVLSINSDHLPVGTAKITGSGTNTPSSVSAHGLAGFAIHTRHARVVIQAVRASSETSVSLGLRLAL